MPAKRELKALYDDYEIDDDEIDDEDDVYEESIRSAQGRFEPTHGDWYQFDDDEASDNDQD